MKPNKILIERFKYTARATFSRISLNGVFICYLMEDTLRPYGVKVYEETGIPAGFAALKLKVSPKFGLVPFIYDNKDEKTYNAEGVKFTYLRIHSGNFIKETLGCPLTGTSYDADKERTYDSRKALNKLKSHLTEGEEYDLEIINLPQSK